jgi:hypothetical protein
LWLCHAFPSRTVDVCGVLLVPWARRLLGWRRRGFAGSMIYDGPRYLIEVAAGKFLA